MERLTKKTEAGWVFVDRVYNSDGEIDQTVIAEHLAAYEEAEEEGRAVILPSKDDEIICMIEIALQIKLYDWQKAYILGVSDYMMQGRATGKTLAYMIKLCLSKGEPINMSSRRNIEKYVDGRHGGRYIDWFRSYLGDIYYRLESQGGLKLRKIYFTKAELELREASNADKI